MGNSSYTIMTNILTSWIKLRMEGYKQRELKMVERVNMASVNAQKLVDEHQGPQKSSLRHRHSKQTRDFNHYYIPNSSVKGKIEGPCGSVMAARYYNIEGK